MDYTGSNPPRRSEDSEPHGYTASYPPEELKTEFQRKYPPDPFGEEMEANARVWKVFKDEATNHDRTLLAGWNKTLDILLIFAGLFSAVATAFVIESYKLLQPDYEEYIATALFVAFSARNSSSALSGLAPDLRNPADFVPLRSSRWLNGIWFTSLVLSLLVAFLCILFKQWLEEYNSRVSAPFPSVRQWARRRMFYFDGLTDWAVPVFIALLPLLLHAALFLFLAGLAVLLWPLDSVNAACMVALTGCLFVFYTASTILPFVRRECPSSTPMISILRTPLPVIALRIVMTMSSLAASRGVEESTYDSASTAETSSLVRRYIHQTLLVASALFRRFATFVVSHAGLLVPRRLKLSMMETYWTLKSRLSATSSTIERPWISRRDFSPAEQEELEARALQWLITSRSTAEVVVVAFQAVGALPPWSHVATTLRLVDDVDGLMARSLHALYLLGRNINSCSAADMARSLRSAKSLFQSSHATYTLAVAAGKRFEHVLAGSPHYDLSLFRDIERAEQDASIRSRVSSQLALCSRGMPHPDCRPHFLLSTALQALHSNTTPLSVWLQLSHTLPLRSVHPPDFVQMTMGLLRHRQLDSCPLRPLHADRNCGIQCSYELLSDIIINRESLGITAGDARLGLDVLLNYCRTWTGTLKEIWAPLEHSHLLALIGSDLFNSHAMPFFGLSLACIVRTLHNAAHCMQRTVGLPLWTAQWGTAIHRIVGRALPARNERGIPYEDLAFRVPLAILMMYNANRPGAHVQALSSDDMGRLPLVLLRGGAVSTWGLLVSLPQYEFESFILDRLGNLLASCLCIAARRGIDVSAEFDTFATSPHVVRRIRDLQTHGDDFAQAMSEFTVLVQHCNEVRPDWLLGILDRDEYDESIRDIVHDVNATASQLPTCRVCLRTLGTSWYQRWTAHREIATHQVTFEEERARWLARNRPRNDYDRETDML